LAVATSRLLETYVLRTRAHWLFTASLTFFLGAEPGKFDVPLFPRFFARLSLRATDKLQQTTSPPTEIDIITGGKSFRLRHKTRGVVRIENQLPFEMFLAR
jgi:hypothetical protein